jgi:hypothetical protein
MIIAKLIRPNVIPSNSGMFIFRAPIVGSKDEFTPYGSALSDVAFSQSDFVSVSDEYLSRAMVSFSEKRDVSI